MQIIWSFSNDFSIYSTRPLRVGPFWITPEDQEHIVIQDLPLHDGEDSFDSILTIANTTADYAGQYTCSVVSLPPEQRLFQQVFFDVSLISDDSVLDPLKLDEGLQVETQEPEVADDDKLEAYQDDISTDNFSRIEELLSPDPENSKMEEQKEVAPEDDQIQFEDDQAGNVIEELQDINSEDQLQIEEHVVSSGDSQLDINDEQSVDPEDQTLDQQDVEVTSEDDVDPEDDQFQIGEEPDVDISSEDVQLDVEYQPDVNPEDDKLKLEDQQDDNIVEDNLSIEDQPEIDGEEDGPDVDGVEDVKQKHGDDQVEVDVEDEKKMAFSSSGHSLHYIPLLIPTMIALTRTIETF